MSSTSETQSSRDQIPISLDPILLRVARKTYQTYCQLHSKLPKIPIGVVINRYNYRGYLIFRKKKPILLPGESFIPLNLLENPLSSVDGQV